MATEDTISGRAQRGRRKPRCPRCGGDTNIKRIGDCIRQSCIMCGHGTEVFLPQRLAYQVNIPPSPAETHEARQEPIPHPKPASPHPELPEPELTRLIKRYCDLRQRGFTHDAIRTRCNWPRHYPNMLLAQATLRGIPAAQGGPNQAFQNWLLATFDAGLDISLIARQSAFNETQTKKKLNKALDAASGRNPQNPVINGPDGKPGRVSWVDEQGILRHRPFDGPFPPNYPQKQAIQQCKEVLVHLLSGNHQAEQDRAYAMLRLAKTGRHCFDNEAGRRINATLTQAGMNDDTKRTIIAKLDDHPHVQQILLQRCGIKSRWLNGNKARFLSRRMREFKYSPAVIRNLMEYSGNDPDTYYIIGADYRIPEPEPEMRDLCIQTLRNAGFSNESIRNAMSTLGVPHGGRHPPKRKTPAEH